MAGGRRLKPQEAFRERQAGCIGRRPGYSDLHPGARAFISVGFAAELIVVACYIAATALFYNLFKLVNRSHSSLAAFFSLVVWHPQPFR